MDLLPCEILQIIISYLDAENVAKCRNVCRYWRSVVDSLPNSVWQRLCEQEYNYHDYEKARKRYGLSWQNAYTALNSWDKLGASPIVEQALEGVQQFQVLPEGVIACYHLMKDPPDSSGSYSDAIIFYDLETLQERSREVFPFHFSWPRSEITEHFISFVVSSTELCVTLRKNKKQYFIGTIGNFENYTVIDTEIYFRTFVDSVIYVSRLVDDNGEVSMKTEPLEGFKERPFMQDVLGFSYVQGNKNLLAILTFNNSIYVYEKEEATCFFAMHIRSYDILNLSVMFDTLTQFGFDWRSRPILGYKTKHQCESLIKLDQGIYVHLSDKNSDRLLLLCADPAYNQVKLYYESKYNISQFWGITYKSLRPVITLEALPSVTQMDIFETSTTHKILILSNNKLNIFGFNYEFPCPIERRSFQLLPTLPRFYHEPTHLTYQHFVPSHLTHQRYNAVPSNIISYPPVVGVPQTFAYNQYFPSNNH